MYGRGGEGRKGEQGRGMGRRGHLYGLRRVTGAKGLYTAKSPKGQTKSRAGLGKPRERDGSYSDIGRDKGREWKIKLMKEIIRARLSGMARE